MKIQTATHSQAEKTNAEIEIHPRQPQDKNSPPDVSINTIAEWMRHYPKWHDALIQRVRELQACDLWALKNRAVTIEDSDKYTPAARERVRNALDAGTYIAELEAAVLEAERERDRGRYRAKRCKSQQHAVAA